MPKVRLVQISISSVILSDDSTTFYLAAVDSEGNPWFKEAGEPWSPMSDRGLDVPRETVQGAGVIPQPNT